MKSNGRRGSKRKCKHGSGFRCSFGVAKGVKGVKAFVEVSFPLVQLLKRCFLKNAA